MDYDPDFTLGVFIFGCSLCGEKPPRRDLGSYLSEWREAEPVRLVRLMSCISGVLSELRAAPRRWESEDFTVSRAVMEQIMTSRVKAAMDYPELDRVTEAAGAVLRFTVRCPLCGRPAGPRKAGTYFRAWGEAGKVQVANLFYDLALTLWGLLQSLPAYLSGTDLSGIDLLRKGFKFCMTTMGLAECAQCGRFTTTIFGPPDNREAQFCRWCLEDGSAHLGGRPGFFGMGFRVPVGEDGRPTGLPEIVAPEPKEPARRDKRLLGPKTGEERL